MQTVLETDFNFPGLVSRYKGKVRDVYTIEGGYLVAITSDRISAFDHILPRPIPYKGQVLNRIAAKFLNETKDIVPNWLISTPHPNVAIGYHCDTYPVEMVIRGYLTGHAWREYKSGKRILCGVGMPEGMKENDPFPEPIITPASKNNEGHDEDISREEILKQGIIPEHEYLQLEAYTRHLYKRGTEIADKQHLLLVDTKYEFGKKDEEIFLIDEIHTPDSSRYFYKNTYEESQKLGRPQKQLSKEFVRQWLISQGFQGLEGQQMPFMSDDLVENISERYIELYEQITGEKFEKSTPKASIEEAVINALNSI